MRDPGYETTSIPHSHKTATRHFLYLHCSFQVTF